jgi:hypothetical protein
VEAPPEHVAETSRNFVSCTDKPLGDPLGALAAQLRADGLKVEELLTGHFAMQLLPIQMW